MQLNGKIFCSRLIPRSVSRWKVKLGKLQREGGDVTEADLLAFEKVDNDPVEDPVDENSFRNMKPDAKNALVKNLFRQRLGVQEIAEILKISER